MLSSLARRSRIALGLTAALALAGVVWASPSSAADATPVEAASGYYYLSNYTDDPDDSQLHLELDRFDGSFGPAAPGTTLRIGSDRRAVLPDSPDYSWLGSPGQVGWVSGNLISEGEKVPAINPSFGLTKAQLAPGDATQTLSVDDVDGPGKFAWYDIGGDPEANGAVAPHKDGYRLGTGTSADGTKQSPTLTLADPDAVSNNVSMVARFTAPGMYCVAVSFSAHLKNASARSTQTQLLRFVVGDSTPVDAPCGTLGTDDGTGNLSPVGDGNKPDPNAGVGPTGNAIWTDGHVDVLHPTLDTEADGTKKLKLRTHDLKTRDYDDVVYYSSDVIKQTLPAKYTKDEDYSFAGAPGQTIWNAGQDPIAGAPWQGLSTQDDSLRELGLEPYQFRLDAVTGPAGAPAPGDLAMWEFGAETGSPATIYASTRMGLPGGWRTPFNTHAHMNWAFTNPGVYCLAFSVEADVHGVRQEDHEQLTMAIGSDVDPSTVTPCGLTQPYPAVSQTGKPYTADTSAAPVLVQNEAAAFTPRLADGKFDVGLRREDPYLAAPGKTTGIDDAIVRMPFGVTGELPYEIRQGRRGRGTQLDWDATGVARGSVEKDITWKLDAIRGPGGVSALEYPERRGDTGPATTFDTIGAKRTTRALWPGSQTHNVTWNVSRPGRYCLDMSWNATLTTGQAVTAKHTLTLIVDGPLDPKKWADGPDNTTVATGPAFKEPADALTRTCAQGAAPTTAAQVGGGSPTKPGSGTPKPGSSRPLSGRDVLKVGHMDVMSTVTEGGNAAAALGTVHAAATNNRLAVTVHDDNTSPATIHDPAKSTFYAAPASRTTVPADAKYAFLGKAGSPVWVLPQTQDPNLLWPGWNVNLTHAPSATGVQWTLNSVKGPGRFGLFENTGFGDVKQLLVSNDAAHKSFGYNQHAHANWAFGADGVYCLNSTWTAQPASMGAAQNQTLLVAVGDLNPATVTPADCGRTATQVRALDARAGNPTHSGSPTSPGTRPGSATTQPGGFTGTGPSLAPASTGDRVAGARPDPCRPSQVTSRTRRTVDVAAQGHFDFGSRVIGNDLVAAVKDGRTEPAVWKDTAGLVFDVQDKARQTVPAGYSFLGSAGSRVWVIPQTQLPGIPWLGWNTQDPSVISGTRGPVTFSISNLSGPGQLAVYTTGSFGGVETKVFGTAAGFPSSFVVQPNVHAHANWAFTKAGIYRLTMTQTATLKDGHRSSSSATLAFSVGRSNPQAAAPTVLTSHTVGRTASGAACTLSADQLSAGHTAYTGSDLLAVLLAALSAIAVGAMAVVAARRRRIPLGKELP